MEQSLHWRAKVARNLLVAAALCWMSLDVHGQTSNGVLTKAISISYQNKRFHDVVEDLERMTGLHFIYSTNKIEANGRITISVHQRSLDDVLTQLGKQLNLAFKVQGKYVVIKTLLAAPPVTKNVQAPERLSLSHQPVEVSYTASIAHQDEDADMMLQQHMEEAPDFAITPATYPQATKDLQTLQVYFDSELLQKIPPQYVRKIGQRHRLGWFASGGFAINDYSVGALFQVGIRSLYLVTSSSWSSDSRYHGAYGLGSSLKIARNFSFNPAITFSPMREKCNSVTNFYGHIVEKDTRLQAGHWQLKWMFQYTLGRHINLAAGPTFNRLHTSYTVDDVNMAHFTQMKGFITATPGNVAYGREPATQPLNYTVVVVDSRERKYQTLEHWVGWEASISYRINFSGRR